MQGLRTYLLTQTVGDLLPWAAQAAAAERFKFTVAQVEEVILALELLPARYQRNRQAFSTFQQLQLFRSRVVVIGCGGLGGYIIEELARLGVGKLRVVDPDVFEEHNLNRQLLSTVQKLGQAKVQAAVARVAEINPAVTVEPVRMAFGIENGREILGSAHVAVDALDSVAARLELAESCGELGIPLVHGAIGGWYGQVATQFPGERTLQGIFANREAVEGVEKRLGNPSFTPAVVASLQVAEVCKILLGLGSLLRNRKLTVDLLEMEISEIAFRS
jgi:molybdopterin/thiamine biosynthesis adenylyltransferase